MDRREKRRVYIQKCRDNGICVSCNGRTVEFGFRCCSVCRTKNREIKRKWYAANPEKAKETQLRSEAKRPGRMANNRRRYLARLRDGIFKKYGDQCKDCGFRDRRALQVDHINGGGTQDRQRFTSANSYWRYVLEDLTNKFQLLCANCNSIKRHEKKEFPKYGGVALRFSSETA